MTSPLQAVLVGAGKVGAGYASDPLMARFYPYATHAQVLAAHPAYDWVAVVDPSADVRDEAVARWGVGIAVADAGELEGLCEPDVAVIATPPQARAQIITALPSLTAAIVEKPLGVDTAEAAGFAAESAERGLTVQVNFWRRADRLFRDLAARIGHGEIGQVQSVFGVYGNGLLNNGSHLVDFVRMLFGEVSSAQTIGAATQRATGPLAGDVDVAFALQLSAGPVVSLLPVDFDHYRENSLDIWGTAGRLTIVQEGLVAQLCSRRPNRAMSGEHEIASDAPMLLESTVGDALYELYGNLARTLSGQEDLWSTTTSAVATMATVDAVKESLAQGGARVAVPA